MSVRLSRLRLTGPCLSDVCLDLVSVVCLDTVYLHFVYHPRGEGGRGGAVCLNYVCCLSGPFLSTTLSFWTLFMFIWTRSVSVGLPAYLPACPPFSIFLASVPLCRVLDRPFTLCSFVDLTVCLCLCLCLCAVCVRLFKLGVETAHRYMTCNMLSFCLSACVSVCLCVCVWRVSVCLSRWCSRIGNRCKLFCLKAPVASCWFA